VEDFPGYLEIVGGEDKMMDLGTMQLKVDSGEYRSVDEIEADLRTLVAAAQAFNPPGTIPYNSAGRLLTHGLKHVDRARPLVRTPTPSPTRPSGSESGTPWRGRSMFSGREMTVGTDDGGYRNIEITPQNHIPEEMLSLPPNSLEALAVGWNLTGGKRVYAKRIIRGREKFVGKWRNWDYDGTRDIAEMEDVQEVFSDWRTTQGVRRMVDWMGLRKDGEWWDWGGYGGPFGQPPVPFTPFPKRPSLRTRELTTSEWGVYPQIEAEMAFLSRRTGIKDDVELLSEHLRPTQSRQPKGPPPPPNFVNMYEQAPGKTAEDWLHDVCTGDPRGEAYIRSVETFVKGAMDGAAQRRAAETGTGTGANADESAGLRMATVGIKREGGEERGHEEALSLDEFVRHHYLSGVFSSGAPQIVRETLFKLSQILRNSNIERAEPAKPAEPADHAEPAPTASSTHSALAELHGIASTVYARVAMRHLARPENPLDIAQFLRAPGEFAHQGLGGKTSVEKGLAWVGAEIERVDGMIRSGLGVQEKRAGHTNGADGVTADGTGCVIDGEAGVNGANGYKADTDALDAVDAVSDKKRKRESSPERSAGIFHKKLKPDNGVIDSVASSPLTQPPDSPRPEPDGNTAAEAEDVEVAGPQPVIPSGPPELDEFDMPKLPLPESLERLRLELVALSKFYPLAALKKVEQDTAEKVLPKAVWHLMVKK
jgi:bromodomain-containing protein 7/9